MSWKRIIESSDFCHFKATPEGIQEAEMYLIETGRLDKLQQVVVMDHFALVHIANFYYQEDKSKQD